MTRIIFFGTIFAFYITFYVVSQKCVNIYVLLFVTRDAKSVQKLKADMERLRTLRDIYDMIESVVDPQSTRAANSIRKIRSIRESNERDVTNEKFYG